MRFSPSRLSVTSQFILLAVLGVFLTVMGVFLTFQRSFDFAYTLKHQEIRHEAEEGASIVRQYVQLAQSGAMTKQEAQSRAIAALKAIRFEGVNYVAILGFDGFSIENANKNLEGHNIINLKDKRGDPVTRKQIAVAMSGNPGFCYFYFNKIGETHPKLKMSYNIGIPEWQWDVTTGDFADDLNTMIVDSSLHLAMIFVPLSLLYLLIVFVMCRSLAQLLASMSGSMRQLSQGDVDTVIRGGERVDEIGQMAKAMAVFREALLAKVKLERETEQQRQSIETERRATAAAQAVIQGQQQAVVTALGEGLERFAHGDLTVRLDQPFVTEYEKLRADFNATATSLRDAVREIAVSTSGITSGSDQIAGASDDLSRRTEQQAANLEQTAAALSLLTDTVRTMSGNASEAATIVATTRGAAETSGLVVHQAVSAMDAIKTSSQQITNIIGVIDEIAFQTNLLALNAGVEAARAGEAGRGFAVVASEVRALAQRSAEAAKEIKALISTSTTQVGNGVTLVDQTGTVLRDIIGQIGVVDNLVRAISASSKEQATGLAEINMAVSQMDQAVQQNATRVGESTAAAHALKGEARGLAALVDRFKTDSTVRVKTSSEGSRVSFNAMAGD